MEPHQEWGGAGFAGIEIMNMKSLLVLFIALLAAGCSAKADGPPAIQVDRTACEHCTMLVSDERLAAAYYTAAGDARVFDDIACLLTAAASESSAEGLRFWFHDAASSEWLRGEDAVFVKSPRIKTPMHGGIVAFRQLHDAERTARTEQGRVIWTIGELLKERTQ